MNNQFLLFLKKARRDIWLKALAAGVSAALAVTGGLLLAAKLLIWPLSACLYGIAALPLVAGLFLLLHRTGEKKLARRLDNEFSLHEKVQTMIAFEDSQEPMAQVQRQDTVEKLGQIPTKSLRFTHRWVYVLALVLSAALMVAAAACPARIQEEAPPVVEPPRDISDWEWQALDDLITWVSNSDADEAVMKPKTLSQLNTLRSWLANNSVTETALKQFVSDVVSNIRNIQATAAEQEGISDTQVQWNTEVADYVIDELYKIFSLEEEQTPDDDPVDDNPDDSSEVDGSQGGVDKVVMAADDVIFDPRTGEYVKYSQVIDDDYESAYNALDDGTLSEQWREFIETYFGNLMKPPQD